MGKAFFCIFWKKVKPMGVHANAERIKLLLRFMLAAVFLFSAISKLVSAGLFEIAIVEQGLAATREQAAYPARLVIALELFLGISLLFPYYLKRAILPLTMLTLAAFTLLQCYQLTLGEQTQDCGCFGKLLPMSSAATLVKNIFLLALSFVLFKITKEEKRKLGVPALLAIGSGAAVLLLAPVRGDYENTFAQYTQFEGVGRVDLTSGDQLVAVFNADCDHCQETARELGALAEQSDNFPQIYVLMFSTHDSLLAAFAQKTHTSYPYHLIAENEFFNLIGNSPPRMYWLRDGKIKARWDEDLGKNLVAAFNLRSTASQQ
ncbi:hypothetical protein HUU05_26940 [candidate division KSB1 bacterium]|nr:hypothetical protein [candidate division KSB1 bacterium]